MESQIPRVFLENFRQSDESFLIHKGMIHTLHYSSSLNTKNKLFYGNKEFDIFPSEDIDTLQEEYLNINRESIEDLASKYIKDNYIDKLEKLKIRIDSQNNIFMKTQKDSIEKLIVLDIFNEFCNLYSFNKTKNKKNKTSVTNPKLSAINKSLGLSSSLDYPAFERTSFAKHLNNISTLIIGQRAYSLKKENCLSKNHIEINNIKYNICESHTLDKLISDYKQTISRSLKSVIQKESRIYINQLQEYQNAKTELDTLINRENQYNGLKKGERRAERINCKIGFKPRGKSHNKDMYEIYIKLDPYIIKKDDKYYQFDTVKIGTSLAVCRDQIKITDKPTVLTKRYHHPFVYSWSAICDKGSKEDRFKREGVSFQNFNLDNLDGFARNVAVALNISRKIMELGYIGSTVSPVHSLNPTKFPKEYLSGGESEALSTGIRIVDNDIWKDNTNQKNSNTSPITICSTTNIGTDITNYLQNNQNNRINLDGW